MRFMMDFLRPLEANPRYSGLTPMQWGAIGFFTVGLILIQQHRQRRRNMLAYT